MPSMLHNIFKKKHLKSFLFVQSSVCDNVQNTPSVILIPLRPSCTLALLEQFVPPTALYSLSYLHYVTFSSCVVVVLQKT